MLQTILLLIFGPPMAAAALAGLIVGWCGAYFSAGVAYLIERASAEEQTQPQPCPCEPCAHERRDYREGRRILITPTAGLKQRFH